MRTFFKWEWLSPVFVHLEMGKISVFVLSHLKVAPKPEKWKLVPTRTSQGQYYNATFDQVYFDLLKNRIKAGMSPENSGWHSTDPSRKMERPMMNQRIPSTRDFETVRKEAKTLLRNLQRNDARASERYHQFDAVDVLPARLSDAQYLVARRYGFKSWGALKAFIISRPQNGST